MWFAVDMVVLLKIVWFSMGFANYARKPGIEIARCKRKAIYT
mgnify:CR=1 FL=1